MILRVYDTITEVITDGSFYDMNYWPGTWKFPFLGDVRKSSCREKSLGRLDSRNVKQTYGIKIHCEIKEEKARGTRPKDQLKINRTAFIISDISLTNLFRFTTAHLFHFFSNFNVRFLSCRNFRKWHLKIYRPA